MTLNITIVGLDALGASLGLALGTLDPKVLDVGRPQVTGWDEQRKVLENARGRLAVDVAARNITDAVRDADVVIVNVPPTQLRSTFSTIAPALKPGAIVSDTTGVKEPVLVAARELLPSTVQFVGGHPFTALGGGGPDAAKRDAFRDVIYCLVAGPDTSRQALNGMWSLVTAIGAKPYYIDPAEHDSYVAGAAHLPLLCAVALMETVGRSGGWREIQPIAGEALLGTTALTANDPAGAAEVLHANRAALRHWISTLRNTIDELDEMLDDPASLAAYTAHATEARTQWLESSPNVRPGETEVHSSAAETQNTSISGLFFGRRVARRKGH